MITSLRRKIFRPDGKATLFIISSTLAILFFFRVSAEQTCHKVNALGNCLDDTCCLQSVCDQTGSTERCCDASGGLGCSACPTCRDCVWGEWSDPKKVSPDTCGDGLQPRKRIGEVTRKYITYPDGEIKSPGGKCDDLRTKMAWEEDCPEHCQLSEWNCGVWSDEENECGERNCTREVKVPPKHNGKPCGPLQATRHKKCGGCNTGCTIGIVSAIVGSIVLAGAGRQGYKKYKNSG